MCPISATSAMSADALAAAAPCLTAAARLASCAHTLSAIAAILIGSEGVSEVGGSTNKLLPGVPMILQEWLKGSSSEWIQLMHSVRRCRPRRIRSIAYADTFYSQDAYSGSGIRAKAGIAEGQPRRAGPDAEAPRSGPFRGSPCLCGRWRGAGHESGGDSSKATSGACAAASSQARGSGARAKQQQ